MKWGYVCTNGGTIRVTTTVLRRPLATAPERDPRKVCSMSDDQSSAFGDELARWAKERAKAERKVRRLVSQLVEASAVLDYSIDGVPIADAVAFEVPSRPARYKKKPVRNALRTECFERDGYRCVVCGSQKALRPDHVLAEFHGGEATLENLQTLCQSCNSSKGKSDDATWKAKRRAELGLS